MAESVARILIQAADQTGAGLTSATAKLKTFGTTVDKVLGKFTGLGAQLGTLFTAGLVGTGIKRAIDGLEELSVASKKTGVAVEDLAKLRFAFEQADVPVESLNKGLRFLNRTLGEAKAGNEKAARALADLGVSANDTALPAMIKIADAIAQIPDAAERATKLNEVFSKSWEDLVPGLAQGGAAIKAAGEELQKLGGVPSQKAAEAADSLNDSLNRLGTSISGPLSIALADILPSIDALATRLTNAGQQAGGLFKIFDEIGERVGLSEYIRDASNSLEFWQRRLAELRKQEAAGEFPFFGGPAKLYEDLKTAQDAVDKFTKIIADARAKFAATTKDTPAVDVLIQGDPNAAADLTADATAASQAAQAAVPPIVVPIAVGPTGAIGSYADLQAEFARQQEGFASGGLLRGPGTGTSDSILARVSNKEYIVNAKQTARFLPLLEAINSGRFRLPRFATGGAVSTSPTASYRFDLNGRSISGAGPADQVTAFASELRREVLRRGRR
jgi:hypothetical protein